MRSRAILALALAAFACRALVPAGFMPGDASSPGWLQICHDGMAPQSVLQLGDAPLQSPAGHHDHGHGHGADPDSGSSLGNDLCEIGAVFSGACISGQLSLVVVTLPASSEFGRTENRLAARHTRETRIRAPPAHFPA